MLSINYQQLMPRSLRRLTSSLPALAALILAGAAVTAWRVADGAREQLAQARLARGQNARDTLEQAWSLERASGRLLAGASPAALRAGYADLARQLDLLDRLLTPQADIGDERVPRTLGQASQLLRHTADRAARLQESSAGADAAFARALRQHGARALARRDPDGLAQALLLSGLQNAVTHDEVGRLGARLPPSGRGAPPPARDLLALRLRLIDAHADLRDTHDELARQALALVAAARMRSNDLAHADRGEPRQWLAASGHERLWLLAALGCGLLSAWLLGRVAARRTPGMPPRHPDAARDALRDTREIGDMTRAIEHFLKERHQIEQGSVELGIAKERLVLQNSQLQREAVVRLEAEQRLRGLMSEQQTILDNVGVGIAFLKERRIVRCNQSFAAMFDYRQAELRDMSTGQLHVSEQAYRAAGDAAYAAVEIARTLTGDMQLKRRDGTIFWVERTLTAIDRGDLSSGAIWVVRDIDQRKRAEALRIEQGRVLEMIATGSPLAAVLDNLARLAESQSEGAAAAILLFDENGLRLRHGAAPGLPDDWLGALAGAAAGPDGEAGAPAGAVRVTPIEDDPLWDDWRALATARGLRARWSRAILSHQGKATASLVVYVGHARAPDLAETRVMDMASRIAGIAIERQRAEERIHHMAHHDALTGLPNRTLLEERLNQAIANGRRHGHTVTVAFIDLDNFKVINDSLGHNAGDELLKAVALRMRQCVRGGDTVVRLGGDEFVIVLGDQAQRCEPATQTLQRIRAAVAQPVQVGGQKLQVTCSMGVAGYPADGGDSDTLLMNADVAMYRAKELGRNNFQFYTSTMNRQALEKPAPRDGRRAAIE